MNYRIEQKPGFNVIDIKETVSGKDGENFRRIPQIWQEVMANGLFNKISVLGNGKPKGIIGVTANYNQEKNSIDYYIASVSSMSPPAGMSRLEIPANSWLVFEVTGAIPEAIQKAWKDIYSGELEASGYNHAAGPELEVYSDGDTLSADYKSEIWIPVIPKNR